jgi:hypothetical protein
MASEPLPVLAAAAVPAEEDRPAWLVEDLWTDEAVGIVGGAPKACKTWLALDLAVSVGSGTPALGRFAVPVAGTVLLYGAEDAPAQLRNRLAGITLARGLQLDQVDLRLIVVPSLRLDTDRDRERLRLTLAEHHPRLLVLDPLVRLHRLDENSAGEVSALLGELRAIQREHHLAIVLVHHLRKNAAPRGQDGQSLRGSGDLHAWGDSNLYLRRRDRQLLLTIEHRSAPAPAPRTLELADEPAPHLRVIDEPAPVPVADLTRKVIEQLDAAEAPLDRDTLRERLRVRNAAIGEVLVRLRAAGRVERCAGGFRLRHPDQLSIPVPTPIQERERNPPHHDRRLAPAGG